MSELIVVEQIRFGDCDPAGVAYYPRIFELVHRAMETYFDACGVPYAQLIRERRLGVPTVALEATFSAPMRQGDLIEIEVAVVQVGSRSARWRFRFGRTEADGTRTACATIDKVVALVELGGEGLAGRAIAWPPELAEALRAGPAPRV